jgi:hypothetical protein
MNIHTDRWYSEFKLPLNKQRYAILVQALVDKGYDADRFKVLDPACGGTTNETVTEKRKAELVEFYLIALSLNVDLDTVASPSCDSVAGGSISLTGSKASLSTTLTGANNDIVWTAKSRGAIGNTYRVSYIDPSANNATLSVSVVGTEVRVSLATGAGGAITSTANNIISAVAASEAASSLIVGAKKGSDTGAGIVTALAATNLTGGAD